MGGQANARRLLGAAALSLTTMAAASGVLAPTAASAAEQTQPATVAAAPFHKIELSTVDQAVTGAFFKYAPTAFLKRG